MNNKDKEKLLKRLKNSQKARALIPANKIFKDKSKYSRKKKHKGDKNG